MSNADVDVQKSEEEEEVNAEQPPVAEIAASSIRSGLAELELKTSQVLQRLENVKSSSEIHTLENIDNVENDIATTTTTTLTDANINEDNQNKIITTSVVLNERKLPSDILKSLEQLIAYTESDEDPEFPLPALDDVSHLALISHSIVAYLSYLDRKQLIRVSNIITNDVTQWLGKLFRFSEPASSFHLDNASAILRTVRLAIVARYPSFLESGIPAVPLPCFYISVNTTPLRLQYACRQLGIPLNAVRVIPTSSTFGTMDLNLLQKQIQTDLAAKCTPLLLVADVGASICGYVDNLLRMRDICNQHNMWLHATGHGLAALVCKQIQGFVSPIVDSMVLSMGSWLGVPSLPIVLLHKQLPNSPLTALESDPFLSKRLNALSLWTSLQALGRNPIAERLQNAFQTCNILFEIVSKCEGMRVLSRAPNAQTVNSSTADNNDTKKQINISLLFETVASVVVFHFDGSIAITTDTQNNEVVNNNDANDTKALLKIYNTSYYDRLNSWLGQILQRDCPSFDFEIIEHQTHGTSIRYCPLELGLGEQLPTVEHLENFAQSLETHVDILRATVKHKATFIHLVEQSSVLRLVQLPEWAGMGGVRFVPEGWESLLTDQAKAELNKLNIDLVQALKSTDNAFSLGEGTDGLTCVRFGMVTHETDVEELLDLVISVGKSVQENSRVLDTMSEIVKKGIEAATADLQRETEEKIWQEGILRHVPVVGRVFNWWSPPQKESGIKGRSLNLTQGVVESTENIYKYHMQMAGQHKQLPANKAPPTPMVQTMVKNSTENDDTNSVKTQEEQSPEEVVDTKPEESVASVQEKEENHGDAQNPLTSTNTNKSDVKEGLTSTTAELVEPVPNNTTTTTTTTTVKSN